MSGISDYLEEYESVFDDVFVPEEEPEEGALSYLESMPNILGGVCEGATDASLDYDKIGSYVGKNTKRKWVSVGQELRKTAGCNKTALGLRGVKTESLYLSFIKCWRWMCPDCGSKGGRIHNKRIGRILTRLAPFMAEGSFLNLRQTVFTLPMEIRSFFMSPKDITALNRMAERVHRKAISEAPSIRYFHSFGDKDKGVFNPHVNIHAFEAKEGRLKLTPEELKDVKYRWVWALKGYLLQVHKKTFDDGIWSKIDVHYSFVEGAKEYKSKKNPGETIPGIALVAHRVKYMSRPHPGFANLDAIKGNEGLLKLFVCEMKGFHYITNCGCWKLRDCDRKEEMREMELLAGERLKVARDKDGHILYYSRSEIDLKWRPKELEELSDGFYRVNEMVMPKKKKKGKNRVDSLHNMTV